MERSPFNVKNEWIPAQRALHPARPGWIAKTCRSLAGNRSPDQDGLAKKRVLAAPGYGPAGGGIFGEI